MRSYIPLALVSFFISAQALGSLYYPLAKRQFYNISRNAHKYVDLRYTEICNSKNICALTVSGWTKQEGGYLYPFAHLVKVKNSGIQRTNLRKIGLHTNHYIVSASEYAKIKSEYDFEKAKTESLIKEMEKMDTELVDQGFACFAGLVACSGSVVTGIFTGGLTWIAAVGTCSGAGGVCASWQVKYSSRLKAYHEEAKRERIRRKNNAPRPSSNGGSDSSGGASDSSTNSGGIRTHGGNSSPATNAANRGSGGFCYACEITDN